MSKGGVPATLYDFSLEGSTYGKATLCPTGNLASFSIRFRYSVIQYSLSLLPAGSWQLTYLVFPFFVLGSSWVCGTSRVQTGKFRKVWVLRRFYLLNVSFFFFLAFPYLRLLCWRPEQEPHGRKREIFNVLRLVKCTKSYIQ